MSKRFATITLPSCNVDFEIRAMRFFRRFKVETFFNRALNDSKAPRRGTGIAPGKSVENVPPESRPV